MQPETPLKRFRLAKQAEIALLRQAESQGSLPEIFTGARPSFSAALGGKQGPIPAVIAEFKRASPSRGCINNTILPEAAGRSYQAGGAACMSVLTEELFFKGKLEDLRRVHQAGIQLPLLRKDFLFDPLQIVHTASTPASALLLIVSLTPHVRILRDLREQAESLGLEAIVEIFSPEELPLARDSGARIIQVNARNLTTFTVDRSASMALALRHRQSGGSSECWIAASGITQPEHLRQAADCGFNAVLVGTALMEGGHNDAALARLLREDNRNVSM